MWQNWDSFCVLVKIYADTICFETHIWNFQRVFKTSPCNIIILSKEYKVVEATCDNHNWIKQHDYDDDDHDADDEGIDDYDDDDYKEDDDDDNDDNYDNDDLPMMTIECPRINQESAGSDNPSIANSEELRQKKPGNGKKKKIQRNPELGKRKSSNKSENKQNCSANLFLAEKMATHLVGIP